MIPAFAQIFVQPVRNYPMQAQNKNNVSLVRQNAYSNATYRFKIVRPDGKLDSIRSSIWYDKHTDSYYLKDKSLKIYANQTRKLLLTSSKDTIAAESKNGRWLFPVTQGTMAAYSLRPFAKKTNASYVQKGSAGQLYDYDRKFVKSVLPNLLADNMAATKAYRRYRSTKRILTACKIVLPIPFLFIRIPSPLKTLMVYNQTNPKK